MNLTTDQIKSLVEKYPYLRPRNVWTGKIDEDYDYTYYHGDQCELPRGWEKLFLLLCKDLYPYLKKANILEKFYFTQVKEKYGTLRAYNSGLPKEADRIVDLYECFSKYICSRCGQPSKFVTSGWVEYICENCIDEFSKKQSREVTHKKTVTFEIWSNNTVEKITYSFKNIKQQYYKVKDMSDSEFFNYMMNN